MGLARGIERRLERLVDGLAARLFRGRIHPVELGALLIREADLAMTYLFGGFGHAFYDAYESAWPLDPGAGARRDLYNLYHVLNHFNLFGGGYGSQTATMIERLLADLR